MVNNMLLSISNIGWTEEQDSEVYGLMKSYGFSGVEIAPTRIFPESPYEKLEEAENWAKKLQSEHGFVVPSMQSIWYGRREKMFGSEEERQSLLAYTKEAVDFAVKIGCKNLVFGCPGNRSIPDGVDERLGIDFFKEIGSYAAEKGTVIGMEANPPIYHTNYINDTRSAMELIEKVDAKGFRLNLDVGTMIQNGESVEELRGKIGLVNHVHISEPHLAPIKKRALHKELRNLLLEEGYQNFVSIEMGKTERLDEWETVMAYVKEIFG
jgi:sugar phosphate isomerase/epimerase